MKCLSFALSAAALFVATTGAHAQGPAVPGAHRLLSDDKADRAHGGQLLLGELNCTSCHATPGGATAGLDRKLAPGPQPRSISRLRRATNASRASATGGSRAGGTCSASRRFQRAFARSVAVLAPSAS